jgi:predicted nucleotidyltransferase
MGKSFAMPVSKAPRDSGLARALFSRVRQRVLAIFFGRPSEAFSASDIIRLAGSGSGAVQRELARLEAAGILSVIRSSNRKHYRANDASPIFKELLGLVRKTVGLQEPLAQALEPYRSKIVAAFVYGSVAKGTDRAASDIDLMIVGDGLSYADIYSSLQSVEKILRRTVNPTLLTVAEWKRKSSGKSPFVAKVSGEPKLFVVGSDDDLNGLLQSGQPAPSKMPCVNSA